MRKIGFFGCLVGAGLALAATTATAQEAAKAEESGGIPGEFSANVALTSDYRFRGISQTDKDPAIQGGIDYAVGLTDDIGFYAGFWGSNVDFNDGDEAHVEIDGYGGLNGNFRGFDWNIGGIYYAYPGASSSLNYDYAELTIGVGYQVHEWVSIAAGYNYSPEYFGDSGSFHYPNGSVAITPDFDLPVPLTLSATVGRNIIDKPANFGTSGDYTDWSVTLGTTVKKLDLSVAYVDSSESGRLSDATAVFTVGMSF